MPCTRSPHQRSTMVSCLHHRLARQSRHAHRHSHGHSHNHSHSHSHSRRSYLERRKGVCGNTACPVDVCSVLTPLCQLLLHNPSPPLPQTTPQQRHSTVAVGKLHLPCVLCSSHDHEPPPRTPRVPQRQHSAVCLRGASSGLGVVSNHWHPSATQPPSHPATQPPTYPQCLAP